MMMPVMDGPTTIRVLRRMNPAVRIIAASGLTTHEHASRSGNSMIQHFLAKPYTADVLLQVLRDCLRP